MYNKRFIKKSTEICWFGSGRHFNYLMKMPGQYHIVKATWLGSKSSPKTMSIIRINFGIIKNLLKHTIPRPLPFQDVCNDSPRLFRGGTIS